MSGYAFHPDAFADLDEIWEYIAQDNIDAADRVLADIQPILRTLAGLATHRTSTPRSDCPPVAIPCRARLSTLSPMHLTRSRFGLWRFSTGAGIRG